MRDRDGKYVKQFKPGEGYLIWKMAGFPPGGLNTGKSSARAFKKCKECLSPYIPQGVTYGTICPACDKLKKKITS